MQMPNLGDRVTVIATAPNVEIIPCTGRFFVPWQRTEVVVTESTARRLVDGALMLAPPEAPAQPAPTGKGE